MSSSNATSQNGNFVISQVVLSFMFATPAVLSNALLLITIYRDPNRNQRIWQNPVTLLVVNLSICDLLAGLIPGFTSIYYNISMLRGRTKESLSGILLFLTVTAVVTNIVSSGTIAAMAFDRMTAVASPLQYKARVTKAKIKVFIAVIWLYSMLFSSLPLMGVGRSLFVLLYCHIHVSVPLITLPVVYWKTFRALRLHNNQVQDVADGHGREQMDMFHKNRERKMISAFLLVLVLFYVALAPQFIAQNMLVFYPLYLNQESFRSFLLASNNLILVNCSLNPFIYAWRIPNYRRAFREVFSGCGCRSCNAVVNHPVNENANPVVSTINSNIMKSS